jgi:hypothetical protein
MLLGKVLLEHKQELIGEPQADMEMLLGIPNFKTDSTKGIYVLSKGPQCRPDFKLKLTDVDNTLLIVRYDDRKVASISAIIQ